MLTFSSLYNLISYLFILNIIFAAFVILFERRRNPNDTLVWLMILLFVPVVGFIFYLFLGQSLRKESLFTLKTEEELEVIRSVYLQKAHLNDRQYKFFESKSYFHLDTINLFLKDNNALFSQDNNVEIFSTGVHKFNTLVEDIKNAKYSIHMEYYIIRNDSLGRKIIELLTEKAKEGLEVRLLYDGMGCIRLKRSFFTPLIKAGGKVAEFFPPFVPYVNLRINYRNHRKITVIDGQIGYTGGLNIGNEYLGLSKRFGYWRDIHLRIQGSAVANLQFRFLLDWRFASKEEITLTKYILEQPSAIHGRTGIQIVSSGPDSQWQSIRNGYLKMIYTARNHLYIETPYFIPDESIFNALKLAALSGVDIRVIVPGKSDHIFVYWAGLSYMGELLEAGVRFFHYNKGFVHSKMATSDGFISSVGTANLDLRSFKVNFEINAFMYSTEKAQELESIFIKDMFDSTELTLDNYKNRSFKTKTKESISRLFSPLL
ncbi:cardiolipin synthetase 2 [Desulfonispora thiosulfatigenes DSM 11270]|uniref:Cardiolipin synthase n=1 Tax=Desulfonispora thiosulfatigenes DSM 11270 TaxID=656914 RepID=A0A1W1VB55_DESTI|nr:cardiolipin synthase [Desulfonispora thiosulfatigenes]SMB90588.1 cardiolipin synthetase 2 [Desulfonispora thiosulfatigenes DSM 11270]